MAKLSAFLAKIKINFSTIIIISLSLISGRYKTLFIQFLLAFIHELFHIIGAIFFKIGIEKFEFLPFGFYVQMENLYTKKWYQELIVVILGPLSFFFSIFVIKYMYIHNIISYVGYQEANQSNLFILIFNLLPIYPLDGGVLLKLFLERFMTQKKVLKVSGIISFIFTIAVIIFTFNNPQLILIGYLVYSQLHYWLFIKRRYRNFLMARTGIEVEKKDILHSKKDLYRPKNNLIISNQKVYQESEYAKLLLTDNIIKTNKKQNKK